MVCSKVFREGKKFMNIFNYSLYMYMLLVLEVNLKFFLIVECVLGIYYDVIIEICLMCFCGFY